MRRKPDHAIPLILSAFFFLVLLSPPAFAHRPTFSDGSAKDANSALAIEDVDVSQVVYHTVTEDAPQLWQTFVLEEPRSIWVQIGVPVIDRLEDYRPAVAILGPGLPEIDLPFDVPEGLGGKILSTEGVTDPREFHEHFTDTRSWILLEENVDLPQAGRHYLVAYVPSAELGKLWVAVGKKEVFGLADIFVAGDWTVKARTFHEQPVGLGIPCIASTSMILLAFACLIAGSSGLIAARKCRD